MSDSKPVRMQGGWGDETAKPKFGRRAKDEAGVSEIEDERFNMAAPVPEADPDSDDDVPAIPDVETKMAEDFKSKVADAPSANIKVTTMADLNKNLATTLPFSTTESGVDLKLLTSVLSPARTLAEEDKVWDFDHLFTSVKSELQSEKDEKEAKEKKETEEDPAAPLMPQL